MNTSSTQYVVPCRSRMLYVISVTLVYVACPAAAIGSFFALWWWLR